MAIIKTAKNMMEEASGDYDIFSGEYIATSNSIEISSMEDELTMKSATSTNVEGKNGGVDLNNFAAPTPIEPIDEEPQVINAYFAWDKKEDKAVHKLGDDGKPMYENKTDKKGNVMKDKKGNPKKKAVMENKTKLTLTEIDTAISTHEYYVVVETRNLPENANIKISVLSKNGVVATTDTAIEIDYDGADATIKELSLNNYFNDNQVFNKSDFKDKCIFKLTMSPKNEQKLITWKENLSKDDAQESVYIKVETSGVEGDVLYTKGKKKLSEDTKANLFLFDNPINIYRCYCDRDITGKELKYILSKINVDSLFTAKNCPLSANDKTWDNFAKELNKMFKKYELNTCIRKIHFLAQAFVESAKFKTTKEYASGNQYDAGEWETLKNSLQTEINNITALEKLTDAEKKQIELKKIYDKKWKSDLNKTTAETQYTDKVAYEEAKKTAEKRVSICKSNGNTVAGDGPRYKGKGLIQLTWRNTYKSYFNYLLSCSTVPNEIQGKDVDTLLSQDSNDKSELLANNLFYAIDSAGWFYMVYKSLIKGKIDNDGNKLVQYKINGKTLNLTSIEFISRVVNGGTNGLDDRIQAYNNLHDDVFKVDDLCINKDKIIK